MLVDHVREQFRGSVHLRDQQLERRRDDADVCPQRDHVEIECQHGAATVAVVAGVSDEQAVAGGVIAVRRGRADPRVAHHTDA